MKYRYGEDAAEAKQHLNHTIIGGREIRIVFAEENRKTPQEMRLSSRGRCDHIFYLLIYFTDVIVKVFFNGLRYSVY